MDQEKDAGALALDDGLARLGELLRKLRHTSEIKEQTGRIDEMAGLLAELAREQNCAVACPDLLLQLTLLGKALVLEGRLSLWAHILKRVSGRAVEHHDLSASHMGLDLLQRISSPEALKRVLDRFEQPDPPPIEALRDYLEVLPTTALATIARLTVTCKTEGAQPLLKAFLVQAAHHHPDGVRELVRAPERDAALLGLELLGDVDAEHRIATARTAFLHEDPAVRIRAAEWFGQEGSETAAHILVEHVIGRGAATHDATEQIACYSALLRTQRSEALARVEEKLLAGHPSFTERVGKLFSHEPADPVVAALIDQLALLGTPQAQDLLHRGLHAADPAVVRACKKALGHH